MPTEHVGQGDTLDLAYLCVHRSEYSQAATLGATTRASTTKDSEWGGDLVPGGACRRRSRPQGDETRRRLWLTGLGGESVELRGWERRRVVEAGQAALAMM